MLDSCLCHLESISSLSTANPKFESLSHSLAPNAGMCPGVGL